MTQAQELWAIKGPDGEILATHKEELFAWSNYIVEEHGPKCRGARIMGQLKERGYRAVRVRVEEIEEGGE